MDSQRDTGDLPGTGCVEMTAAIGAVSPELGVAQIMVAHVYGVSLESLLAATRRGRRAAEARQVAMYLAHVVFRMSLAEIARGFGRDRTTARPCLPPCRGAARGSGARPASGLARSVAAPGGGGRTIDLDAEVLP